MMPRKILAIGDLANNFVILRKYIKNYDIHVINFPWDTASKLTESKDVEFFNSLKIKEQIKKINEIKNNYDFAIVNTWAGARLAYLTGLDYIFYFVGSALRVPPFIKNPRLDYLQRSLPSLNLFERRFYKKIFDNSIFCVANASDLFELLKKYRTHRISQIGIPVDTEMFNENVLPLNRGKKKFTFVSPQRIGLAKGIDIIWKAIELTRSNFEVLQVEWFLGQRTDEEKNINKKLIENLPKKVKLIPVLKREEIPNLYSYADGVIGQMKNGLGAAIEREAAFCHKPVIQFADPEIKFKINDKIEISSPFLPHSNDPQVLADLIDKIVESEEFRKDLAVRELEFVKQIADPHKISHEWEKLFDNYMGNIHEKQIISSKEIRNRQNNFFIINRLYLSKIKKKITRNE